MDSVSWFDFVQVPQGYIKINGSCVLRPKGMRAKNNPNVTENGRALIDPTDDQIIEHAKSLMKYSKENPNDYTFVITSEDFRSKK